jgi:tetratricopeptide (TPR) repeat protein
VLQRLLIASLLVRLSWGQTTLERGMRAFDRGDYGEAARLFEEAHRSSTRCDISFFLGMARYRLRQMDAALIAFQSAVQCDSRLVLAHVALAEAYSETENRDEALKAYTNALRVDPNNDAALRGAASIYLELEHPAQAVPLLEMLVRVSPSDPHAHSELAAAYFGSGNMEGAEKHYQDALRLEPNQLSALLGLGYILVRRGEDQEAIPLLEKAAAAAPKEYRPHFLLGSAYNHMERFREAVGEFETALRLGSNDAEVYYQVARAYGKLDRQDDRRQALARFSELTNRSNENLEKQRKAVELLQKAKTQVESGDLRAAAATLEEARVLRPADDKVLFRLAGLHFDLKQMDLARNYAQEAISLAPSEWLYHYLLGLVERADGRRLQARSSLEIALKLNASAAEVHNALGELALDENDPERAVACFQRASDLDPKQPSYREHLASAKRQVQR